MRPLARRAATLLTTLALASALLPSPVLGRPAAPVSPPADSPTAPIDASSKLRGDLAALVAGEAVLDPCIAAGSVTFDDIGLFEE